MVGSSPPSAGGFTGSAPADGGGIFIHFGGTCRQPFILVPGQYLEQTQEFAGVLPLFISHVRQDSLRQRVIRHIGLGQILMDGFFFRRQVKPDSPDKLPGSEFAVGNLAGKWIGKFRHF